MQVLGKLDAIPLEGIFTDVFLLDRLSAERYYNIEALREDPKRLEREEKRVDGLALVQQAGYHRLMILGKPGAGKTTFLKSLTLKAVEGKLDKVPIFVSLKEWSDSTFALSLDGLLGFIDDQFDICGFPDAKAFVDLILRNGKALVLLDGLDEVNQEDDKRRDAVNAIRSLAQKCDKAQCVVTCRVAANDYSLVEFKHAEMAGFDQDQVRMFVDRWFKHDVDIRERFRKEFEKPGNTGLRELANSPMLLSLLCLSFEEALEFPPGRRVEIYKQAVEALMKRWDKTRGIVRDQIYKGLSLGQREALVAHVAANSFDDGDIFIKRDRMAAYVEGYLRKLPKQAEPVEDGDGDSVLRAVEAQHGVWVERAKSIYSFSHLSLHEYFAAHYVVRSAGASALNRLLTLEHLADDRWREVILNTASLMDDADEFFAILAAQIERTIHTDKTLRAFFDWVSTKAQLYASTNTITARGCNVCGSLGGLRQRPRPCPRSRPRPRPRPRPRLGLDRGHLDESNICCGRPAQSAEPGSQQSIRRIGRRHAGTRSERQSARAGRCAIRGAHTGSPRRPVCLASVRTDDSRRIHALQKHWSRVGLE